MADLSTLTEPRPADPEFPRYGRTPFPPYRYVPGLNPHPVRDPKGHSYGRRAPEAPRWRAEQWRRLDAYLDGVDLFNFAYWWECHECLEPLWIAARGDPRQADFVQGLVKVAAACLNKHCGKTAVAARQAADGIGQVTAAAAADLRYMGIDTFAFALETRAWFEERGKTPPVIRLD